MKNDLRISKTESAIEGAFLELIELKGYENVHIIDIAKKANVNRNTIYLRYGTKEDIISKVLEKAFAKQIEELNTQSLIKTKNTRRSVNSMFNTIFNVLSNDIELYRIVLTDPNLSGYVENIFKMVRSMIMQRVNDTKKNKAVVEYILKGSYGIIQNWIIFDTGSIDENVKILTSLVVSNLRHLSFK